MKFELKHEISNFITGDIKIDSQIIKFIFTIKDLINFAKSSEVCWCILTFLQVIIN